MALIHKWPMMALRHTHAKLKVLLMRRWCFTMSPCCTQLHTPPQTLPARPLIACASGEEKLCSWSFLCNSVATILPEFPFHRLRLALNITTMKFISFIQPLIYSPIPPLNGHRNLDELLYLAVKTEGCEN